MSLETDDPITPEYIAQEVARAKPYHLVVLSRGPADRSDPDRLDAFQLKHLQHLFTLRRSGKLVLNGPSLADSTLRGISIFAASSIEEVQACVANDPMVMAGYLTAEIYPWLGLPGDRLP